MRRLIIFLILLQVAVSCNERSEEKGDIKEIEISRAYDQDDKVFLSEVADSITYISLETDTSCFIKKIRNPDKNIQFAKDRLFISDGNDLFSFKNSGKFLFKIGKQGKGPGEYYRIDNYTILNKQKLVLIYSAAQQKIMIYNFDNKHLKTIKIDFWPLQLCVFRDKYIVFGSGKGRRELTDYYTISMFDIEGKQVSRLIYRDWERKIEEEGDKLGLCNMAQLYNYCDTLSYWEYQYNKIWRISSKEKAYQEYYINLGPKKYPRAHILESAAEIRKGSDNYAHLWRFTETDRYFFFRVGYERHLKHILFDKKTEKLFNVHHMDNGHRFEFANDIDGGMTFWPDGLVFRNKVFSIEYGYEVYQKMLKNNYKVKQPTKNVRLEKMVQNCNIMDNPILMVVHLKN